MKETKGAVNVREDGFLTLFYDFFRSLKLTITLLILLASLSIIGTLITQNATRAEYLQRYGIRLYEVLNFFNLFDMYHSWWFSAILLLLVINLITCSVQRLPGIFSQISHGSGELEDRMLNAIPYVEKIQVPNPTNREENIQSSLKRWFRNWGRIETERTVTLFSEKGKFSRLGVPITHLSILIILTGGIVGSVYGFKGHVEILKGETVDRIFLGARDEEIPKPLDFSVRCDDFKVTYYDPPGKEKHVKEYTSFLTILKNGKEVLKKAVQVNHPLHYKGLAFYQANYGTIHDFTLGVQWRNKKEKATFKVPEGATVTVPNSNGLIRILQYAPQIHNFGEGVQVVLFEPNQEPRTFWLLKAFPKFDEQRKDDFILSFEGDSPREYTGLSVTKDPGVWVVWIGCGLMIFGFIVSFFFSHQRVWVRIPKSSGGEIVLAGSANKNRVGFEKTFGELVEGVRKRSSESRVRG
ncbi:MAG TPA: cytochrome c biogenesis protein ResB [Thermodesulfobacteriota bacterium]|nr:cytochrome c biogenesis protein ResB [Thermodesulfobacteriota bacterium]